MVRATLAQAGCALNGPSSVGFVQGFNSYAVFDCVSVKTNGRVVLTVSVPTTGWRYQVVEPRTPANTWRTGAFTLDTQNLVSFSVYLGPVNASVRGCGEVTVTTSVPNGAESRSTLSARTPDVGTGSCTGPVIQPVTASLVGGVLPSLQFSFQDRVVSGSLAIRVENPSRTSGWTLSVSSTNLIYAGAAPGQPNLPASSLRVLRPGLSPLPLSNSAQQVVGNGGADAVYTLPMELVVPGGTASGTYSATITIATTNAPGK
jgi:hypothetical protein